MARRASSLRQTVHPASRRTGRAVLAVAAALAAVLALAAPAAAGGGQFSILQDERRFLTLDPPRALAEAKSLGVEVVKVNLAWRSVAPRSRPGNPADPNQYDQGRWEPYDEFVRAARAQGLRPFLMASGPGPDWAGSPRQLPPPARRGSTRPSPAAFGDFLRAAGTRYSGSFPDPRNPGATLPRVDFWSLWNEPNLTYWLAPQGGRPPQGPTQYRNLLYAGHRGLADTGHGGDEILIGELTPTGTPGGRPGRGARALGFLRELACVDGRFRPLVGRAATARGCQFFRRLPGTGFAYHPYTFAGGPRVRPVHPDDATIGSLGRLTGTLGRLGFRFARGGLPVYITEYGVQTSPPDPFQTPLSLAPGHLNEAEYLAFRHPGVRSFAQYPLTDDSVAGSGLSRFGGFQSGLRFGPGTRSDGRTKPTLYRAFQLPIYARVLPGSRVEVFGGVRARGLPDTVTVFSRLGRGGFAPIGQARLRGRYFLTAFRVSSPDRRQYFFRYGESFSRLTGAARR